MFPVLLATGSINQLAGAFIHERFLCECWWVMVVNLLLFCFRLIFFSATSLINQLFIGSFFQITFVCQTKMSPYLVGSSCASDFLLTNDFSNLLKLISIRGQPARKVTSTGFKDTFSCRVRFPINLHGWRRAIYEKHKHCSATVFRASQYQHCSPPYQCAAACQCILCNDQIFSQVIDVSILTVTYHKTSCLNPFDKSVETNDQHGDYFSGLTKGLETDRLCWPM